MNKIKASLAVLSVLLVPAMGHAESNLVNAGNATAHLDFRVTIPSTLFLRIGTGALPTAMANNATVDLMDFTVPAANIGDGTVVNAAATSGDLTNGAVTVRVYGNGGNGATLNSTTSGRATKRRSRSGASLCRITKCCAPNATTFLPNTPPCKASKSGRRIRSTKRSRASLTRNRDERRRSRACRSSRLNLKGRKRRWRTRAAAFLPQKRKLAN